MNRTRTGFSLAALAAVILLLFQIAPMASAQDQDDQDPPTRAGRLGYVQGAISYQVNGQGDWLDAVPNRPLTTGDNLWADKDSRAEVQIGSTSVRLNAETSITLLDLGDNITQIRLSLGSLFFRVPHLRDGETFEVDTPNLAFTVDQPGEYRLDVNENGDQTAAVVWRGDAEITGGGSSYRLEQGQQGTFSGTDQLTYDIGGVGQEDAFDVWCRGRDDREDRLQSRRYVSQDMTGYEDLDEYGRWRNVPDYGNVWTPVDMPAGWAPYRFGHWAYVWPWGWTWVDDEPWGFAPFHYGRWAFVAGGWCWVPGPVAVAPVYSPALVVFIGGSPGFGAGVGWFPLGPGEVYVPWYRTSPRYVQEVNISNTRVTNVQVTNVYNNVTVNKVTNITYVNQRVNNSVTVVNRQTFVNAQSVRNNVIRVDERQIANARPTHTVVQNIEPQRQSIVGASHPVRMAPPQQVQTRPVVATRQPVISNRPAPPVAGFARPTPAPVRTVRAAPPTQAQPLQRGARGSTAGAANNQRNAPAQENNRGPATPESRPGATENRPGPQGPNRPSAPENNAPRQNNYPRPGAPQPGAPNANAPNNRPSENAPNNNPNRGVPRPPSSRPEQPQTRPEQPQNQQRPAPSTPQEQRNEPNARPQPTRPESPRTMPEEPARPESRPQSAPPENQRQNAPADNRREVSPPPERQAPSPRPETRTEPAPRPEARPASPPPQRESRPQPAPRNEKSNPPEKNKDKDNKPPFR